MKTLPSDKNLIFLPNRPIEVVSNSFNHFTHIQASSGIVLIICAVLALAMVHSPWATAYQSFWNTNFTLAIGSFKLSYPLWYWVNDALMAVFFFVIGLEIKRELVMGELQDKKAVILPAACALGGAVVPAILYFFMIDSADYTRGWAIPMATDIAFAVGLLSLLGTRVPRALKVFLLSLAIIDDLIAVIVIALFYSSQISLTALSLAAGGLLFVFLLNRLGVRSIGVYFVVGALIWLATLKSGIHPTIAGVILGLMTPASGWIKREDLAGYADKIGGLLRSDQKDVEMRHQIGLMSEASKEAISPLQRLENQLHPWVAFVIMPVFALANAGVVMKAEAILSPLSLAVIVGLVLGKPIGIFLTAFILIKTKIAALPLASTWTMLFGVGCLAGIGFTMSIFIAGLSFDQALLDVSKTGILIASLIAAILGMGLLSFSLRTNK